MASCKLIEILRNIAYVFIKIVHFTLDGTATTDTTFNFVIGFFEFFLQVVINFLRFLCAKEASWSKKMFNHTVQITLTTSDLSK